MLIGSSVDSQEDLYFGVKCAGHGIPAWRRPGPNCHLRMKVGDVAMIFDSERVEIDHVLLWHRHCVEAKLQVPWPEGEDYLGESCLDCSRPITNPADLFVFNRGGNVFIDRQLVWHRHCIEAALVSAPVDTLGKPRSPRSRTPDGQPYASHS